MARHVRHGDSIHYAAFSTCAESLSPGLAPDTLAREAREATAALGLSGSDLTIFDFKVREFHAYRQEILEEMIRLRAEIQPDVVYLPASDDVHQDHHVVFEEGVRAFKQATLLGYELPWNSMHFRASAFVILSEEDIARKIAALQEYRSQAHRSYMSETFIRSVARVRGEMARTEHAEAFEPLRVYFR